MGFRLCIPTIPELDMDVPYLLLILVLSAVTLGLVYGFERLRGSK